MALSANRLTAGKSLGSIQRYQMAASQTIYAGSLVCLNSSGLALPAADTVGYKKVVGVATEKVVSDGSTTSYIHVQEGVYLLAGTSLAQARVGEVLYVSDDQTVTVSPSSTNHIAAGVLVEYVSATSGWVLVGPGVRKGGNHVIPLPVYAMTSIANGDIVVTWLPAYAGRITKVSWLQGTVVTTGSKAATLTPKINTTALTGGVLTLASATCTPIGAVTAGTAVTALNSFDEDDTITITASGVTAFAEGAGTIYLHVEQF